MSPQLDAAPVVAILRGVQPGEILEIARALIDSGVRAIEVPLTSPEALESIRRLAAAHARTALCGAGTVLRPDEVDAVREAGGSLIVTPNTDVAVIRRALSLGLAVMPGFATATEAFEATAAGARHLKLFPAATYGPAHLRALRAVLPADVRIHAVGGVEADTVSEWLHAGADGVAVGSNVFKPGWPASEVARRAAAVVAAFHACSRAQPSG